jgi:methyl-accepting chemotaxis protein
MRRLKLPQKFALIAVLLVTPFVFVAKSYIGAQDSQKSFAVGERVGIRVIDPMTSLLGAVGAARGAAAGGGEAATASVQVAVGQVDRALEGASPTIHVSRSWARLKARIGAASTASPKTGAAAVRGWSGVSNGLVSLIAAVADQSQLTLDPILNTYYLQDAVTVKIPQLLAQSGLAASLTALDPTANRDPIAVANGTATTVMADLSTDLQKATRSTSGNQLAAVTAPLATLTSSAAALTNALTSPTAATGSAVGDMAATVRRDALALAGATTPQLDTLLRDHVNSFQHKERTVEIVGAITLLLALWLFVGFFRSMTGSVNELIDVLSAVESGDLRRPASPSSDEVGQMAIALNRMRERMSEMVDGIARTSVTLSSASEELSAVSNEMSSAAEQTADRAGSVSSAAEHVSDSVQTVSAGTEEMGASINEIAKQAADAARVATEAVAVAEATNSLVARLGESSGEIDEVIKIISSIAKQTNLLALNATIEAARAGEAGKGFAVVASEVKELARDTARSSEKIERNIAAIQADTREAIGAIGQITSTIHQINDIQTMIASAVEEQAATTNEIARSVGEAASGSNSIAGSITGVADAARDTNRGAAETHRSAEDLARIAGELLAMTRQFHLTERSESFGQSIADAPASAHHVPVLTNGRESPAGVDSEPRAVTTNGKR